MIFFQFSVFDDPSAFDFLGKAGSNTTRGERYDSLFLKFDPLAQKSSMLPQKNTTPTVSEDAETESKPNAPLTSLDTPKKNPAVAAIDRLLFYSPLNRSSANDAEAQAKVKKVN